ncbi:unnamed protein product [Haemonchus placei]|uniref:Asparaginase n=1 Tax=Haemonchus placei TaxID=6290 RepID=A0A0N4XBG9_HAEPC|nr:unnamed protein product [Haemonchus placei]
MASEAGKDQLVLAFGTGTVATIAPNEDGSGDRADLGYATSPLPPSIANIIDASVSVQHHPTAELESDDLTDLKKRERVVVKLRFNVYVRAC